MMGRRVSLALFLGLFACNALFGIDPPLPLDGGPDVDGDVASSCESGIESDGGIAYFDISAGAPPESAHTPVALIDAADGKLLVVTEDGSNENRLALFRCGLDGSCCARIDISAGRGPRTGYTPAAIIDEVNHKLLVAAVESATSFVTLYRCNLDGTSCTASDVSGQVQGQYPSIVIDAPSQKLLVVTLASQGLRLARCELDGSQCAFGDLGGGHFFGSGPSRPSAAVDDVDAQLLVAVGGSLVISGLDGTNSRAVDLAADLGFDAGADGGNASELIDLASSTVLIAESSTIEKPALFRAALDGGQSTFVDISAGQVLGSGYTPSAVIDPKSGKLLVATIKKLVPGGRFEPALFRCNIDGSSCTYIDISAGHAIPDATVLSAAIGISSVVDTAHSRLLVAATDGANANRLGLFSFEL